MRIRKVFICTDVSNVCASLRILTHLPIMNKLVPFSVCCLSLTGQRKQYTEVVLKQQHEFQHRVEVKES